jgi:hypothetical protein
LRFGGRASILPEPACFAAHSPANNPEDEEHFAGGLPLGATGSGAEI